MFLQRELLFHVTDCEGDQFQCFTGRCIEGSKKCDGRRDCNQGEDEINCGKMVIKRGKMVINRHNCMV